MISRVLIPFSQRGKKKGGFFFPEGRKRKEEGSLFAHLYPGRLRGEGGEKRRRGEEPSFAHLREREEREVPTSRAGSSSE